MTLPSYSLVGNEIANDCATKTHLVWRAIGTSGLAFEWCGTVGHGVRVFRGSGPPLTIFHLTPDDYVHASLGQACEAFATDCQDWLAQQDLNRLPPRR